MEEPHSPHLVDSGEGRVVSAGHKSLLNQSCRCIGSVEGRALRVRSDDSNAKSAATMLTSVVAERDGDEGGDDVEEDEPEGEDDVGDTEDTEDDGCKCFAVADDTIGARAFEEAPSFA
eukprot:179575-Pyramimonas_sp.AAC.1